MIYEDGLDRHITYDDETEMYKANYGGTTAYATTKEKAQVLVESLIKTYEMRMGE